ncbi:MAG TPA: hypothetical protein VKT82_23350 [Ktedonobacterales bacterium]|nr:hypothetical protein [Ktedonobacterales bacterium]
MDQVLSDRLIAAFPHLYRSWQGRDMRQVWRTRQDFECGNGWFELLWQLSAQLETLIAALPASDQDAYAPANIKEKFGGLRFYMNKCTPEMDRAIRQAEGQSIRTCEVCGQPGTQLKQDQLILARCPEHAPPTSELWQPWHDSQLPKQTPDVQAGS